MADVNRSHSNGKRPGQGNPDQGRNKMHRGRGGHGSAGRGGGSGRGARPFSTAAPKVQRLPDTPTDEPDAAPSPKTTSHLSDVRFDSLRGIVDDRILAAIKFEYMSVVQAATLQEGLSGIDLLAQAKTGTGKTIAFLLPAIQRLLTVPRRQSNQIYVLILSPTRELALQIEKEAQMLMTGLPGFGVQHVVGGTNMTSEQKRLARDPCNILVATPGRLLDHFNSSGLAQKMTNLTTFVLDEADRMLDMGFRNELEQIKAQLPDRNKKPRQSLLFSATFPKTVLQVADVSPNHKLINTIPEEEQNTHQHVAQDYQTVPMPDVLPLTLAHIVNERRSRQGTAKIIIFLPTARATQLAFEAISSVAGIGRAWEIHSRKSQSQRARASEEFRQATEGILFSSDVAARGVDFPNVSLVIQAGLPSSSDQYIHRLGRTARAGAAGRGVLILADFEAAFLNDSTIKTLPLKPLDAAQTATLDALLDQGRRDISAALARVSDESKSQAYQAALGYYNSSLKLLRWNKDTLVAKMNEYARDSLGYGGNTSPPLLAKTVGKMGLKGVAGLNVVKELPQQGGGHGKVSVGGGGGGGGARGNGRGRGRGRA